MRIRMPLFILKGDAPFPDPRLAHPSGLLAIGGDLSEKRLLDAYSHGIFPWYSEGEPIQWFSPEPRLIIEPREFHVSRSLHKVFKKKTFHVTFDTDFELVITMCARIPRSHEHGTWITRDMQRAYCRMHRAGYGHSVEVWLDDALAGGLYGLSLGGCFFGESMFSAVPNASKTALAALAAHTAAWDFDFIDCQLTTPHLLSMGGKEISRAQYLKRLEEGLKKPTRKGPWHLDSGHRHVCALPR
jgi:leucyl/phenylalanyl-tRNA---protein transferase